MTRIRYYNFMSKYSEAQLQQLATSLSIPLPQLFELREIFSLVDLDSGGTISAQELSSLMHTLGIRTTQQELQFMINEIDKNKTGEISFADFVTAMSRPSLPSVPMNTLVNAFKLFDKGEKEPTGRVYAEDLVKALTEFGQVKMNREEAEDLIMVLPQVEEKGYVEYEAYLKLMFSCK